MGIKINSISKYINIPPKFVMWLDNTYAFHKGILTIVTEQHFVEMSYEPEEIINTIDLDHIKKMFMRFLEARDSRKNFNNDKNISPVLRAIEEGNYFLAIRHLLFLLEGGDFKSLTPSEDDIQ